MSITVCNMQHLSPPPPPPPLQHTATVKSQIFVWYLFSYFRTKFNPLSTDFSASRGLKVCLRTQTAISQPLQALPPRQTHRSKGLPIAHPMMKGITQTLFKCVRYMALSEGSPVPRTGTENPIVLGLWSSYEVRSFASRDHWDHFL